jgi:alkylation response protein AidB-like acyl-CoA dehydrogenase
MDVVATAQQLADELLFPAALATDAAGAIPKESLDALADAGLYGTALPEDLEETCAVLEALAGGCLSTAFVWMQHLGVLRAALFSEREHIRAEWSEPLARGERRGGLALGGALPGPPLIRARETDSGWLLDGTSPWLSGWGRIDIVHTGARTDDERLVWLFVDAKESDTLSVALQDLMALRATATVLAEFNAHFVPEERVVSIAPYAPGGGTPPEVLRIHSSLALGVTNRCCRLLGASPLGASPLEGELNACRARLAALDPARIAADRADAGELAIRSAAALMAATGSRSILLDHHPQRLAREALFASVYALRPASREALLRRLGAA